MNSSIETESIEIESPLPAVKATKEQNYLERIDDTVRQIEQDVAAATALTVSVVIPVYNERETIAEIVRRVQAVGIHREIVIVDDYSLDGTREVLAQIERQADVRLLMHGYNRGKGAALRTAFSQVRGDVVLIQDADLEYDPSDYARLLAPIECGAADVVYGSRFLDNAAQDPKRLHRWGNWLLTFLSNCTTGQRLTDMETCYKVLRREILDTLELEQDRFGFEPEITAKLAQRGYHIHEVPIRYQGRSYDQGKKIGFRDACNALGCIARYGWATSTSKPLWPDQGVGVARSLEGTRPS